jgi:thiamine-phosphate pyrophosphorylase
LGGLHVLAATIRALTRAAGVLFFVNDRFDLALACGADGVHLGQQDLPPSRIPPALRARLLVGRSTHTAEQVEEAMGEGVDYVAFGPVFGTRSKDSCHGPRGIEALRDAARRVRPLPLIAIGGIDVGRVRALGEAGAEGAAVISAVAGADDPEEATRALVSALEPSSPR